jgi:hypothetical protein
MSLELSAAALTAAQPPTAHAGYGISLTDLSAFHDAMRQAEARGGAAELQAHAQTSRAGPAVQALFEPLEHINGEAASLKVAANAASAAGQKLTPGEMVMLTVRCQEFMFHCQLTSNIANRASDGLQQLFRQQS